MNPDSKTEPTFEIRRIPGQKTHGRPPRRAFVDHAARETLSATLTPSSAAGSADGERCKGSPVARAAAASEHRAQ
jgi:hypothetical protein